MLFWYLVPVCYLVGWLAMWFVGRRWSWIGFQSELWLGSSISSLLAIGITTAGVSAVGLGGQTAEPERQLMAFVYLAAAGLFLGLMFLRADFRRQSRGGGDP